MLKKSLVILIFALGLTVGFSARANDCPTDNGLGVGCNIGIGEYYCGGACRTGQPQCLTWTPSPICASGFSCSNFATADACGYGATCASGYTRCGTWPNYNCTATIAPVSPCSTYDTCNNYCTACISGYALCSGTHTCVADPGCLPGQTFNACTATCEGTVSMLKLGYDSVSGTSVIQSATYPTLFIPSSSNVGIGTSTPIAKLEVIPTSGYSILAGSFKIGNVALPTADSDAASKGYVDSVISSATSSLESFWGGTLGGSIWNLNTGNVGIGTTTPIQKLEVSGGNIKVSSPAAGGAKLIIDETYSTGGEWAIQSGKSAVVDHTLFFRNVDQDLDALVITKTGNVGIGTTSPLQKFHVAMSTGSVQIGDGFTAYTPSTVDLLVGKSNGNSRFLFGQDNSTYGGMIWNYNANQANAYLGIGATGSANAITILRNNNVGIGTTTPVAKLEIIPASGYSILAGSYKIGNIALPTADADAATKGYVDSTIASATSSITLWGGTTGGNIWSLNSGNVGIGTTNPLYALHIYKTGVASQLFINNPTGSVGDTSGILFGTSPVETYAKAGIFFERLDGAAQGSLHFATGNTGGAQIVTKANARMTIDMSGNVGIGTTTPLAKLQVYDSTAANSEVRLGKGGDGSGGGTGFVQFLPGSNIVNFYNNAGSRGLRINTNNGIVGGSVAGATVSGLAGGLIFSGDGGTTPHIGLTTTGNFGIGTTSPLTRLHVSNGNPGLIAPGSVPVTWIENNTTNYLGMYAPDTANSGIVFGSPTDGFGAAMYWNNNNSLLILGTQHTGASISIGASNNTEAMRITNLGAVGIGTSTPNARLEVIPASGYSILAGSYKIGNVALPTADADAATKGYVDSTIASATSSITALWGGTTAGNIWNLNSGNVGIGTNNPLSTLHISTGDGQAPGTRTTLTLGMNGYASPTSLNTISSGDKLVMWNNTVYKGAWGLNGSGTMWIQSTGSVAGAGNIVFYGGASSSPVETMRILGTGNVGIGTTTPLAKLAITGIDNGGGVSYVSNIDGPWHTLRYIDTSGQYYWQVGNSNFTSPGEFRITGPANSPMWLVMKSTGLVGVGTAAPLSKLGVLGNVSIGATYGAIAAPTSGLIVEGNVGIGTTTPNARLEVIPTSGYSILAGSYKIGDVALPTADADAATKGYVDSTVASATSSIASLWGGTIGGNIWNLNSGGVGIGTINPSSQLQIELNTVGIGTVSVAAGGTVVTGVGTKFLNQTHQGGFTITIGAETRTITSPVSDTSLNVSAPFTNAYTDSPYTINGTSKVAIDGNSYARFSYSSILTEINSNNNGAYGLRTNSAVKGSGFYLYNSSGGFYTQGGLPMFYATATGKFGIGTTSPAGFLHVEGTGNVILNAGNVGIGTTSPLARLEVMPASGYSILAGSYKIGNVALPTADADAATKGYVDSTIASATSSISNISVFVGVTTPTFSGNNNGNNGYAYAHAQCASAYAGSHVCAAFEILNTIKNGGSAPSQDAWIFNGPPAYTALANDCDARTSATSAAYGTYWQKPATGYPEGRGLLMLCNNVLRFACCQ